MDTRWHNRAHLAFLAAMGLKWLDGLIESAAGAILLATGSSTLLDWVRDATAPELREDPTDFIATHARALAAHHISTHFRLSAGAYLLVQGLVKLSLASAVLRGRLRAYPWAIAVLGILTTYLAYRAASRQSPGAAGLFAVNAAIVGLLAWEYARRRRTGAGGPDRSFQG